MSESAKIENVQVVEETSLPGNGEATSQAQAKPKKVLDPGAKRNLIIIGVSVLAAILLMVFIAIGSAPPVNEKGLPQTVINQGMTGHAEETTSLTPDEIERLNRVNTAKAEEAIKRGDTFIPSDLPNVGSSMEASTSNGLSSPLPPPPGTNYSLNGGAQMGGQMSSEYYEQEYQERKQRLLQGMQAQLERIAQINVAPPTSSAGRYEQDKDARQSTVSQNLPESGPSLASNAMTNTTTAAPVLVNGLHLAAAELLSPIETDKTSFASAKITSGPLSGAVIYGSAQMVADVGVHVRFSRMLFNGRSYAINAVALDPVVSHDTLSANVDRKIFERYVLPILGATASGYLQARAQPPQTLIAAPGQTAVIVQPAQTAKQSLYQGLAKGVDQAMNEFSQNRSKPSASLPAGSPIGVLFLDPVLMQNQSALVLSGNNTNSDDEPNGINLLGRILR